MTKNCACGFLFVTDEGHDKPVTAKCPQCGTEVILDPAEPAPAPTKTASKKGATE